MKFINMDQVKEVMKTHPEMETPESPSDRMTSEQGIGEMLYGYNKKVLKKIAIECIKRLAEDK